MEGKQSDTSGMHEGQAVISKEAQSEVSLTRLEAHAGDCIC